MKVLLVQLDGKLPNLALMKLSAWHRQRGDEVDFTRRIHDHQRGFFKSYDKVYGSTIFEFSAVRVSELRREYPDAIIGGTGLGPAAASVTVERVLGEDLDPSDVDYTPYPDFTGSLGFTQRGCRLSCKFCVVPQKEGKNHTVATIGQIWRGAPYPRHLHLLDNDFFGQPQEQWEARIDEIRSGGFKVCFNQGINIRLIGDAGAKALKSVDYRDDSFEHKRIYTAWDNYKDEKVFFRGVDKLGRAGIPPSHIMVYMLVGYDPLETWDRIFDRFDKMKALGVKPYPMVYDIRGRDVKHWRKLKHFQRWAIWLSDGVAWKDYVGSRSRAEFDDRAKQLSLGV